MRSLAYIGLLLCLLVPTPPSQAAAEDTARRFYGLAGGAVECRIENDPETGDLLLSLALHAEQGELVQLLRPTQLFPDDTEPNTFSCTVLLQGRMSRVRLSPDQNGKSLNWIEPASLHLADGTVLALAGKSPRLDEDQLMGRAEASFAMADGQLNRIYDRLRNILSAELFEAIRANQLRWLRYRDDFIVDGDNLDSVGPGSLAFIRNQTARTHERVRFLESLAGPVGLGLGGLYSDGIDRVLALSEVVGWDSMFFTLRSSMPRLHTPGLWEPVALSGSAAPWGDGEWRADVDMSRGLEDGSIIEGLQFEAAPDGRSVLATSDGATDTGTSLFDARFFRVGPVDPAREPMRGLVLGLPEQVFDNTTEGLGELDKALLATEGAAAIYRLEEKSADCVEVVYPEGSVTFRRFAEHDGGAVIAVATQNLQAGSFELWRIPVDGAPPALLPLDQVLARPAGDAPSPYPQATSPEIEFVSYSLAPDMAEIAIRWRESGSGEDQVMYVAWDGYRFGPME